MQKLLWADFFWFVPPLVTFWSTFVANVVNKFVKWINLGPEGSLGGSCTSVPPPSYLLASVPGHVIFIFKLLDPFLSRATGSRITHQERWAILLLFCCKFIQVAAYQNKSHFYSYLDIKVRCNFIASQRIDNRYKNCMNIMQDVIVKKIF